MRIAGIQKLTMVDYPGILAATIFLQGCDLRCGFCHNPDLVFNRIAPTHTKAKALEFLKTQRRFIDGVCITGGEPLVSLDIDFLRELRKMDFKIKLDTNGFHPKKLKLLLDENLIDYIAIDIKGLPLQYATLAGCKGDVDDLIESIRLAVTVKNYEFRTTVVPTHHTPLIVKQMMEWLLFVAQKEKLQAYYVQQFVPRRGKMLSSEFDNIRTASNQLLEDCHTQVKGFFDICEIRKYYEAKDKEEKATVQEEQLTLQVVN